MSRPLERSALPTGGKRRRGGGTPFVCSACRSVNWLRDPKVAGFHCRDCGALQDLSEPRPDPAAQFEQQLEELRPWSPIEEVEYGV